MEEFLRRVREVLDEAALDLGDEDYQELLAAVEGEAFDRRDSDDSNLDDSNLDDDEE